MKRYYAEFVGTLVLVFGGCGTAVLAGKGVGTLGISLAFGLTVVAMAYGLGAVSGAHLNPAVTIGLAVAGRHDKDKIAGYVVAQMLGGLAAAALLYAIAGGAVGGYDLDKQGLAANGYGDHSPGGYGLLAAALTEILLTALLVLVVLGSTHGSAPAGFAGVAIGLTLTLIHLVGIPVTNLSVNPARSFGPALMVRGWALEQLWLFVVAPLAGAVLAAVVHGALVQQPAAGSDTKDTKDTKKARQPASRVRTVAARAERDDDGEDDVAETG